MDNPGLGPVGPALAGLPSAVQGQTVPFGAGQYPPEIAAEMARIEGAEAVEQEDGSVLLEVRHPELAVTEPGAHGDNLAEVLGDADRAAIVEEVLEGYEADLASNQELFEVLKAGQKLLPLKVERASDPFVGASGAIHPMMLEALQRFVATALAELYPAGGPARSLIEATGADPEIEGRAQRKQKWLNYYLTTVDEEYYPDCDVGLLKLGLYGSIFRKVARDPVTGQPRSRFLTPFDLVVSFSATSLGDALRATQVEAVSPVEFERRILIGYYRQVARVPGPGAEVPGDAATRGQQGRRASDRPQDAEYTHLHCHCWLAVPGFEHADPETGAPTGLRLPWIATVDRESRELLRLERDWIDGDPLFRRRQHYSHYRMSPGLGFYGWGFLSLMASVTDTASTLWRQAINAFTLASFPGGFRAKSAKQEVSNIRVGPCEFPEVDTGGMPIRDAIMPLPYKDVPTSFAPIMDTVLTAGQRLGQTVDMQVGEGNQQAPVGTTLALIQQAMLPTAAVIRRLWAAQRRELGMLAAMFAASPGARYPYLVDGKRGVAMAADFADAADIVPVCDPNLPTQTQRLTVAQGKLQLAQASGGIMDVRETYRAMLRTMGSDEAEIARLMPDAPQGEPSDVVSEFAKALRGEPLAAGPAQLHEAHLRAHIAQMQIPNLPPNVVQALLGHCGEHLAIWYALEAMRVVGQPIDPSQPMPPELEALVAVRVAEASAAIVARIGPALGAPAADPLEERKVAVTEGRLEADIADSARKAEETARQDATEILKAQLAAKDASADRTARLMEKWFDMQREAQRMAAQARQQPRGPAVAPRRTGWPEGR